MRWATRSGPHVDRTACAWLIRRFVDGEAEFVFVDDPDEVPCDATPFDMRGVELSHHDGECSFEAILRRQLARSVTEHEQCVEFRTSVLSRETNSETQPWAMLGLVGHPFD